MNGASLVNNATSNFAKAAQDFALATRPATTSGAYDKIDVTIEFKTGRSTVWFDNASLVFVP
jgi:hypothetical protein